MNDYDSLKPLGELESPSPSVPGPATQSSPSPPDEIPGLAPFGRRAAAFFVDFVIVSVILTLATLPLTHWLQDPEMQLWLMGYVFKAMGGALTDKLVILGALVALFVAALVPYDLYFIVCESAWATTPGKKIFRLRVESLTGEPLTFRQCCLRQWLRHLDLGLIVPGVLGICLGGRRQRLGDWAAGTVVVRVPDVPPWEDPTPIASQIPRV